MNISTFCAGIFLPCALAGQESSVLPTSRVSTAPFDIVITEIMADPDPSFGLPEAEYVEILNRSPLPVNLSGWSLYDGSSRALPGLLLQPGEYLVICANADTSDFLSFGAVAGISSLSLTNSGEKIAIRNNQGLTVDSVIYSDAWHSTSYKQDGGWSLERIDVNFTCPARENWKSSSDVRGGTPGAINSAAGTFTDEEAPVLLRAFCPDSSSVMLIFSEALDPVSVNDVQNFIISDGLVVTNAVMADASYTRVLLHLSAALDAGDQSWVYAEGPADCAGNKVARENLARFGLPDSASNHEIVINEILFNPFENGYDFVELYNYGNRVVDLANFRIASINQATGEIDATAGISDEPWLIFPGDYMVLSEKPEQVAGHYRTCFPFNFITVDDMPSMNIDAGHIAILFNGEITDQIKYREDYHFPLLGNVKGISLEKIHPLRNSLDPTSWHSAAPSAGYATPGLQNSQFSESISGEKDVNVSPAIFSPDFDGQDDVITFSLQTGKPGYISNIRIYNSEGYMIFENPSNTLIGTSDAFSWDGIAGSGSPATPGIYVALVEIFNLQGDVKNYKLPFVLAVKL